MSQKSKLHICIDCRHLKNYTDGLARYVYDITLEISKQINYSDLKLSAIVFKGAKLNSKLSEHNIEIHESSISAGNLKQHCVIPILLFKIKADVYYYPFIDPPLFCFTKKRYFAIHDLNHYFFSKYAATERWYAIIYTKLILQLASILYNGIITFSDYVANQVKKTLWGAKNVISIYHGLSIEHFNSIEEISLPETDFLLYIGNNRPHKNIQYLLHCFKSYLSNNNKYALILAGNQIDRFTTVENWLSDNESLRHKVIYHHQPTQGKVNYLYRKSTAIINLSVSEGFGFPILEAWHFCKPIIVMNASCFPEIANYAALYVEKDNLQSFLGAIEALNNQNKIDEIITNGKQRLSLFNWKTSAIKHLKFLSQ